VSVVKYVHVQIKILKNVNDLQFSFSNIKEVLVKKIFKEKEKRNQGNMRFLMFRKKGKKRIQ
jgi:hypothetical protein